MLIAYGFRVNLSVAIVAMTDTTPNNNTDIPVSIFKRKTHNKVIITFL